MERVTVMFNCQTPCVQSIFHLNTVNIRRNEITFLIFFAYDRAGLNKSHMAFSKFQALIFLK